LKKAKADPADFDKIVKEITLKDEKRRNDISVFTKEKEKIESNLNETPRSTHEQMKTNQLLKESLENLEILQHKMDSHKNEIVN